MRGIGWDDKPMFLHRLQERLRKAPYNVELDVFEDEGDFGAEFLHRDYDFVLLDVVKGELDDDSPEERLAGKKLAQTVRKKTSEIPIFFITEFPELISTELMTFGGAICVKSKAQGAGSMAFEIKTELEKMGVWTDVDKILLVCNQHGAGGKFLSATRVFCETKGLRVLLGGASNFITEITGDLALELGTCSAFIAICGEDDEMKDGSYRPRQETVLGIGACAIQGRGLNRLIILRQRKVALPDGLEEWKERIGHRIIEFDENVKQGFGELLEQLRELGVNI